MKWVSLLFVLCFVTVITSEGDGDEDQLPLAEPCNVTACLLPNCRCFSTNTPGGLAPRDTPQFVTLTYDDAINVINIETYREVLYGRRNSDGCPIGATFYVNHEYSDYVLVNELFNQGFEISLHSISHRLPESYWADASYEELVQEFAEQRQLISRFANVTYDEIQGTRIPFLQMAGNNSFQVLKDYDLTYDSSWTTFTYTNPGLWPYTLDYASNQDCEFPPCPTASFPGVWVSPLISWIDLAGFPCIYIDGCSFVPEYDDENGWFQFILMNFERHYFSNRAPFGLFTHESFIASHPAVKQALIRFLNLIGTIHDVFLVNTQEVIDWVKSPVHLIEYRNKTCKVRSQTECNSPNTCYLIAEHVSNEYWVQLCGSCPRTYPWLGNPLGL